MLGGVGDRDDAKARWRDAGGNQVARPERASVRREEGRIGG